MSNIWDKIYSDDSAFFGEDPLPVTNAILNNEFKIGVLLCYKFLLKLQYEHLTVNLRIT